MMQPKIPPPPAGIRPKGSFALILAHAKPNGKKSGGGVPPSAVSFRTAEKTCGHCVYMKGSDCSKLNMAVEPGDGCNLFAEPTEED